MACENPDENPCWDDDLGVYVWHSEENDCTRTETSFSSTTSSGLTSTKNYLNNNLSTTISGGSECNSENGGDGCHEEGSYHCCGGAIDWTGLDSQERQDLADWADENGYQSIIYDGHVHITYDECLVQ